ncbi:MAG: sodium-dependent bicarbonate transport family permease [Pararhodobacter sp.]
MEQILSLAGQNLLSPIILCFVLGLGAALARSDLTFPEAIAKGMSLYLLFAIGFKGGASVSAHGADLRLGAAVLAGVALSLALPFVAFGLLRMLARGVSATDAAAVAGHYGSISIVTFVAASSLLGAQGIPYEGYLVAVAAAMEAPAIISALWLATCWGAGGRITPDLWREILLNGSIVLLLGAFAIGWMTGERGLAEVAPLIVTPFKGVLCLFLLDMGIVAGRGLRSARGIITPGVLVFGLLMPLVGASTGLLAGLVLGMSTGGVAVLMVLAASASYIAVPAAMRVALPRANPALYLTLALGITFPFNLTLGIPLYMAVASALTGG